MSLYFASMTLNSFLVYLPSDVNVLTFLFMQVDSQAVLDGRVIPMQGACYTLKVVACRLMSTGNVE